MNYFEDIFAIIESNTGIRVNESHRNYVINFINSRIAKHPRRFGTPEEYAMYLLHNPREQKMLIDEAAINETYFFREETHFDYLKEKFLPQFAGRPINIWSAACSTGEESISLYAMASALGAMPTVFGTDIDSRALSSFRCKIWKKSSFRSDGQKYHPLLERIGSKNDTGDFWTLNAQHFNNFHISSFNLINDPNPSFAKESIDLIFLRNVFIYFSRENQFLVLKKMWDALRPGGLLFLSINEIANFDRITDPPFEKDHEGPVYFFRKISVEEAIEKKQDDESRAQRQAALIAQTAAFKKSIPSVQVQIPRITIQPVKPEVPAVLKPAADIEKIAEDFLAMVSEKKFCEAEKYIEGFSFKSSKLEYKYYLLSRMYNQMEDRKNETAMLDKTVIVNPKFWPAWMSLGFLHAEQKQPAKQQKAFEKAHELLEKAIAGNLKEFDFIVESFDLSYFLNLCENYI